MDPSIRGWGMFKQDLDLVSGALTFVGMKLIETDNQVTKQVRVSSDNLRRAVILRENYHEFVKDCHLAFSEVPSGGQSAKAVHSFGMVIGLLASCPVPLIEVQQNETKLATVGTKTASKQEMIEWAGEAYPNVPWLTRRLKGEIKLIDKNEHLADAAAVTIAGMKTKEFQQLTSIWRASKAA